MFVAEVGSFVKSYISSWPYVFGYVGRVFSSSLEMLRHAKATRKILIMQLLFTFIEALPIILVLALALGSALFIVGFSFLQSLGQGSLMYLLQVIVIVREMAPILVAFVVTARSATAIATELAGMVTTHQIESYVSVGIDPIAHLVAPRFIGVTFSVFFLTVYFCLAGILGPFIALKFLNPAVAAGYFSGILAEFDIIIILTSIVKSFVFGMVISITSTFYGFNVERSSTEVPVAGILAVTKSFFGIILADVAILILPSLFNG